MQFDREIINNPEMPPSEDKRSRLYEKFNSMRSEAMPLGLSRLTTSKLKTILLVFLISFTSLLVRQTLQIQHSCNPMIHWSGDLPAECQVTAKNDSDSFDKFSSTRTQTSMNEFDNSNEFSSPTKQEFETPKQQPSIAQNAVKPQVNEIINSTKTTEPETTQDIPQPELEDRYNSIGHFVEEHSNDIVGVVAGAASAAATVAAASATAAFSIPVAGAVAIGMGIWFLIRSVL